MASSIFHGDETVGNKVEDVTESDEDNENINISLPPVANLSVEERFGTLEIFKRPLCLVSTDSELNLQINDEVLLQISRIDVPISVVGVCGAYRTGKSYLMNILAQERTGFALGSTVRSKTKGIWAWCKPHPKVSDQVLVLLDTEGLADAAKGNEEHEVKLFCLTMLMSSTLIYNMKGVIDQDALKKLSFITDLTKQVSAAGKDFFDEEEDTATLQIISPHFVFCLRDFYYDLVDEGELTPDGYMESCLSESSDKKNDNIRRSIRTFFPNRKCFVLAQPALNEDLKCLETLDKGSIAKRFWVDVEKLQTFVYNLDPKYITPIARNSWDGNTFEIFLRAYIHDLSNGHKMEYENAMKDASKKHNEELLDTVCRKYEEQLNTMELPLQSQHELIAFAMPKMLEVMKEFNRDVCPYEELYYKYKAEEKMTQMMTDLVKKNSCEVFTICFDYLKRKHKMMIENRKLEYGTERGIRKYEQDFETLKQDYDNEFCKYDSAERCEALQKFNDSIKSEVAEMKYEAIRQEDIKKLEQSRKSQLEMENMKNELDKLKYDQAKEMEARIWQQQFQNMMVKQKPDNVGFWRRIQILFTGNVSE